MDIISKNFDTLKKIRLDIKQCINNIIHIKTNVKNYYMEYIKQETSHFFGLDSFHFQNKVIELEYDQLLKLYHYIDNRIYGDYYKLYILIEQSLKKQLSSTQYNKINDLTHIDRYPVYKDLEPYKIYEFDLINQLHQDIIIIIKTVKELYNENINNINEHKKDIDLGMNIDNYIINITYINNNILNSNDLYKSYITVYHKYHIELLSKFKDKIQLFYSQIKHHINNSSNNVKTITDSIIPVIINDVICNIENAVKS